MSKTVQYYELNETNDKRIYLEIEEDDDFVTKDMIKKNKIVYHKKLCLGLLPEDIIQKIYRQIYKYVIYPINEIKVEFTHFHSDYSYDIQIAPNMSLYCRETIEEFKNRIIEYDNIINNTEIEDYDDGTADYIRILSQRDDLRKNIKKRLEWVHTQSYHKSFYFLKQRHTVVKDGIEIMRKPTVEELKGFCKMNGLKKYSKLKRNDLIKLLMTL